MSKQSDLVSVSQGSGGDPLYIDTTNDRVGVGTTSPSTLAHLKGSGDYAALTIETATTGGASYINLGDSNDLDVGQIAYYNSDDSLRMKVNASERMRIDNAGRVTMPYQPFFHAYGASSHTATKGAVLPFSQVATNIGSHYNNINRRFTCPVSGRYFFSVGCRYNTTSGPYVRFTLRKNGSLEAAGLGIVDPIIDGGTSTGYKHGTQVVILDCAANDYFEVIDYSANTNQVYQLNESHFIGYLIG